MEEKNNSKGSWFKRVSKVVSFIVLILVLGGLGGVIMERYLFPKLSTYDAFANLGFIQRSNENVTIINKTEQVTVKEDDSINKISSQASTAVVNIISVPDPLLSIQNKNGTGLIVTSDGYLVTYRDAILEENASYKVLAFDGSAYDAKLIGIDSYSNLAFLKMEATNLPVIAFANSDDFRPGKKLVAIGNSFEEYQNRYSAGLLSNLNKIFNLAGKTVSSSEKLEGVFEVDFDNQGEYLGGPIIDYGGDLVGIIGKVKFDNEDKFFQIPSNQIKAVMDAAISGRMEERASLGVYYIPITKSYAISHDLEINKGALVFSPSQKQGLAVIYGSAAENAGIRIGDIIMAVNENEVNLDSPLSELISQFKVGDKAIFKVKRGEEEMDIEVEF